MRKRSSLVPLFIIMIVFSVMIVMPVTAAAKNDRVIIYYVDCENYEIVSDIENSIRGITPDADANGISIKQAKSNKCGYMLINRGKKRFIGSVFTDVDLWEICKEYFEIK